MRKTEQEIIDLFGEQLYVIRLGFSVQFKLILEKIESMENAYQKLCKTLDIQPKDARRESSRTEIKFPDASTQTLKLNR